ncbi:LemA family protein, partial [Peptostreptococcaceae bacterium OttesenSCG-928-C18]|nr:LemA family protein [Peptostreptococcaceae bacterium OttesenSCG-928-C18]
MVFIIIIALIAVLVIAVIGMYNSLIKQREMVKNSRGQISAQVESRWDALSNLIDATKFYEKHEDELLKDIT